MVRVAVGLLVCLALAGCARPAPTPRVTVEPLPTGDWRATWHAGVPVESMRFVRAAGYLREREWRVVTPGYAFGRDGDAQTLALAPGATAADTIIVEFPRNTDTLDRDYELFNAFTDGSVALFAGHFAVAVNDGAPIDRVQVTAPPGQHAIGRDYVYVGTLKPVMHEHMITILDPGLPRWLARTLLDYTPRMLDVYAERTGHELSGKPLVLFSYDPSARRRDVNGGQIGGQLQLRVLGHGWTEDDPYAVRAALHLIAHEAAHLWSGYVSDAAANTAPWMHEGSADAFADAALVELGIVGERQLEAIRTDSLNDCLAGRRIHYTCGRMAAWWTELATGDLFAFWGALIERARHNGDGYDADDYFAVLAERGATHDSVATLHAFVSSRGERAEALQRGLAPYGVSITRDDAAASPQLLLRASGATVMAVLGADCTGTYGFYTRERTLELGGLGDCRTAREGFEIGHIGPHALDAPGFAAARYAVERCGTASTIDLEGLEFACPAHVPAPVGYWRVE